MTCDSESEKNQISHENENQFSEVTTETGTDDEEYSESEQDSIHEAIMYQGTHVKPLSHFGTFEIKPEVCTLKWIYDHTSGKTHPDMPTISMLYNQDLCLPVAAELFVAQSRELEEEARWEKLKAVFYSLYSAHIQSHVHEVLCGLSVLEASRVIAKKTSRFEHEVLLRPLEADYCNENDVLMLEEAIREVIPKVIERISSEADQVTVSESYLQPYTEYPAYTMNDNSWWSRNQASHKDIADKSKHWVWRIEMYQMYSRRGHEACLWLFQLENSNCRFDPRTLWIHLKTTPRLCASKEDERIPEVLRKLPMLDDYCLEGDAEKRKSATRNQIEQLEIALKELDIPFLQNLDSLHNHNIFEQFELCVPYARFSPKSCTTILQSHFNNWLNGDEYFIVSKPILSAVPRSHHTMRVYIDMSKVKEPNKASRYMDSTLLRFKPYEFCFNCFSKAHTTNKCTETKRGFGQPTIQENEQENILVKMFIWMCGLYFAAKLKLFHNRQK
ncbi:hypothetical protein OXX79_005959 [Metschnikowia pulcherrima]